MSVYVIVDDTDQNIIYSPILPHLPNKPLNASEEVGGCYVGATGM